MAVIASCRAGLWAFARAINCGAVIFCAVRLDQASKASSKTVSVRMAEELYRSAHWFPDESRVPHISLVFREMWDTTAPSL